MRSLPLCLCLDISFNKYKFLLYRLMLQFTWVITEKVRRVVELNISYFSRSSQCIDSKIECSHIIRTEVAINELLFNKFWMYYLHQINKRTFFHFDGVSKVKSARKHSRATIIGPSGSRLRITQGCSFCSHIFYSYLCSCPENDNSEMKPDNSSAANSHELEQKMVVINSSGKVCLILRYFLLYYHLLSLPFLVLLLFKFCWSLSKFQQHVSCKIKMNKTNRCI
jgi:hypothetical protein